MAGLLGAYQSLLSRRPMLGNVLTSAVLFATGDVIAQQAIEKKGKDHDYARTGRIVVWGGGIFAPAVTVWFRALERVPIKAKWPGAIARMSLDQFLFAPMVLTGFFTYMTLAEGKDMDAVKAKWNSSFESTLKTNWGVFIPVQLLNMALVPLQYRLLVINGVNIPWNAYLSLQANKGKTTEVPLQILEKAKAQL
ncbi:protein SYM1 [Papiliotrema laurentii]|uniref:Protein SYM1 n=1 Tax=Papiliotrema laurentii TaxID=5418 RepID=A0AAD9CZ03_PAPLA|nr:protein SYM1 [Papiliotrema laurentii]